MPKPSAICLFAFVALLAASRADAAAVSLKDAPFSAAGDGVADDRPALAKALASLKAGDTLIVPPGTYRIVLTKDVLKAPPGVTIWGQADKSKFVLATAGGAQRAPRVPPHRQRRDA